jgi:hypothetical protein
MIQTSVYPVRVYALVEPDRPEVRYVGQTQDSLQWRLGGHLRNTSPTRKTEWIQGLLGIGQEPRIFCLQKTTVYRWAILKREKAWMRFFYEQGHDLLNYPIPGPRWNDPTIAALFKHSSLFDLVASRSEAKVR